MTECNVENRTIFCDDNLDVMQGINSECVDLIYLDPPFNKNKKFTAPIGTSAEGASFKDIFREEDVKDEWLLTVKEDHLELYNYLNGVKGVGKPYNFPYLAYMAIRLIECHRVLKKTGSIFLHCDPTMSHYLKTTMDCVFGEDNFRNEIVWCYTGPSNTKRWFPRKHDTILFYAKSKVSVFNADDVRIPYEESTMLRRAYSEGKAGIISASAETEEARGRDAAMAKFGQGKIPESWWIGIAAGGQISKNEITKYPTQKPLKLLERIVKASSKEGDMVLDPFCGCATTCIAAERLNRNWIGIDISVEAYNQVNNRLKKEVSDPSDIFKYQNIVSMRTDPPKRTDQAEDYREVKFVYAVSHPNYPGEYKVGITNNFQRRLSSYQTSDPERQYKMEYKFETPHFREIEAHIHQKFNARHEWVKVDLKTIIGEIEGYKPVE